MNETSRRHVKNAIDYAKLALLSEPYPGQPILVDRVTLHTLVIAGDTLLQQGEVNPNAQDELNALMLDWIKAERFRIMETSGVISNDLAVLEERMKDRAENLGIRWTNDHLTAIYF